MNLNSKNEQIFYEQENKYLYDIPESEDKEKTTECNCCGKDFTYDEIELCDEGNFCKECLKWMIKEKIIIPDENT